MYMKTFPTQAFVVMDDSEDVLMFVNSECTSLLEHNFTPRVSEMRETRMQLRALQGQTIKCT